jgi:hypothetical protein
MGKKYKEKKMIFLSSKIKANNQKENLVIGNIPTLYTLVDNTKLEANLTCLKPPTLLENTTCCIK